MTKRLLVFALMLAGTAAAFAQTSELSVEKIMKDPKWMGNFPSAVYWGNDSQNIYFDYNPEVNESDSLYRININHPEKILKVSASEEKELVPRRGDFNADRSRKVYAENGNLFLYVSANRKKEELLDLPGRIENPQFLADETKVAFQIEDNAFIYNLKAGTVLQLTHIDKQGASRKNSEKNYQPKTSFWKTRTWNCWKWYRKEKKKKKVLKLTAMRSKTSQITLSTSKEKTLAILRFHQMPNLSLLT